MCAHYWAGIQIAGAACTSPERRLLECATKFHSDYTAYTFIAERRGGCRVIDQRHSRNCCRLFNREQASKRGRKKRRPRAERKRDEFAVCWCCCNWLEKWAKVFALISYPHYEGWVAAKRLAILLEYAYLSNYEFLGWRKTILMQILYIIWTWDGCSIIPLLLKICYPKSRESFWNFIRAASLNHF